MNGVMRSVGWSLFGFALVVGAVALGALTTPAVDHGLATVAVGHHDGFTRRQWVHLAIAALFFIAAAAAGGALIVTRLRASRHAGDTPAGPPAPPVTAEA